MNTQFSANPGQEKNQPNLPVEQNEDVDQGKKDISLPGIDRPQGPFEHSGETSRWTKEEKEEQEPQNPANAG